MTPSMGSAAEGAPRRSLLRPPSGGRAGGSRALAPGASGGEGRGAGPGRAAVCLGKAGGGEGAAQLLSGAESRTPTPLKRGTVGERLCCLRPLLLRPRPPTCQPSRALARVPLTLHRIWLLPGGNTGPEGRMAQQRPPEALWGLCASRPAQLGPAGRRWRRGPASVPSSRVTNSHISVRAGSD